MNEKKDLFKFVELLTKMNGAELCGVAKILNVPLVDFEKLDEKQQPTARNGQDIVIDLENKFVALDRSARRRLMRLLKKVN